MVSIVITQTCHVALARPNGCSVVSVRIAGKSTGKSAVKSSEKTAKAKANRRVDDDPSLRSRRPALCRRADQESNQACNCQ